MRIEKIPRMPSATRTPPMCKSKLNGVTTIRMIAVCASIGTTSFKARPTSSAGRDSGETSSRSWEPVLISSIRLAPVNDAPIRQVIAMMPGTNHWSAEPLSSFGSNGAKSARKTSGCTIANRIEAGSCLIGFSSRVITFQVSAGKLPCRGASYDGASKDRVLMLRPPRSRSRRCARVWWTPRPRGGCGR